MRLWSRAYLVVICMSDGEVSFHPLDTEVDETCASMTKSS